MDARPEPDPLIRAERLRVLRPGGVLFDDLTFELRPGLTLVRGAEGRGKSTLLRLLAGAQAPDAGSLRRPGGAPFLADPADPGEDRMRARDWLRAARDRHAGARGDDAVQDDLVEAFGLAAHLDKSLYMLSTGSRRKLGLVAAFTCEAPVTLLDTPFAALDGPSRAVLADLLVEAAAHPRRGWVIADYELPEHLPEVALAGVIDLGD